MRLIKSEEFFDLERICKVILAEGDVEGILIMKDRVLIRVRRKGDG